MNMFMLHTAGCLTLKPKDMVLWVNICPPRNILSKCKRLNTTNHITSSSCVHCMFHTKLRMKQRLTNAPPEPQEPQNKSDKQKTRFLRLPL